MIKIYEDIEILKHNKTLKLEFILNDENEMKSNFFRSFNGVKSPPLIEAKSSQYYLIDREAFIKKDIPKEWLWQLLYLTAQSYDKNELERPSQVTGSNFKYCILNMQCIRVLSILETMSIGGELPYIIAIDGPAASGKTTLANLLKSVTHASVVHMDDFFLPASLRTKERLLEPGGNIHYERFKQEVVPFLKKGRDFSYQRFDCEIMAYNERIEVPLAPVIIVEGSYSHHPFFDDCYDLRVFSHIEEFEQKSRIKKRNGTEMLKKFEESWIPMENMYFKTYGIKEKSKLIV